MQVQVQVPLPTVSFSNAPAAVVVSPGIRVVPEYEEDSKGRECASRPLRWAWTSA